MNYKTNYKIVLRDRKNATDPAIVLHPVLNIHDAAYWQKRFATIAGDIQSSFVATVIVNK